MLAGLLPILPSSIGKHGDEISAIIARASGHIDPSLVRFSQDSISYFFKNGDSIDDLADGLRSGKILPSDVPPIRLAQNSDGLLFTLDNRRLEAFRRAGTDIPFVLATADEVAAEAWKFTTRTLGETIRIR